MLSPWRDTSGSATPRESTRLRMISTALARASLFASLVGARTTEMPPWRSRPSCGDVSLTSTTPSGTSTTRMLRMRRMTC
jgi:hypothetical protein